MNRIAIDGIPLFATLPDDARERVATVARSRRYKPGEVVIEEGAVAAYLFGILDGAAQATVGGEVVNELGPGDFFGEIGVLPDDASRWRRRTATVTATSRLDVVSIPDYDVRLLVDDFPSFGELLRSAAGSRVPR